MAPENDNTPIRNTFNLARNPLSGFNFIDASAGTGKTYTICGLVLRLLIEKGFSIDQILVVTYTEAATEDLHNRIREKLRLALEAITTGKSDDIFLQEYLLDIKEPDMAKQRINDALRGFDEASIFTIHSFCQRQLLENSFESNTLFDTELVADDSYLAQEIIEDFWRLHFYEGSDFFSEYICNRLSPEILMDFMAPFLPRPSLKFIPEFDPEECRGLLTKTEEKYSQTYLAVCKIWNSEQEKICKNMLDSDILKKNIYKKSLIPVLLKEMGKMATACIPSLNLFDKFALFTSSKIISSTKKHETPVVLPFYEACENLVQLHATLSSQFERYILALKKKLTDSFQKEFDLRKKKANIFSFDDLLKKLHGAFSEPKGKIFARTVSQKFPVLLIDEFQDTDQLQFEIFSTIYRAGSTLFLIGDPKQAIYSFRGANIFTYMNAAASTKDSASTPVSHHTLGTNHRSTPELVKAINTLFSRSKKPFVFEAISFQKVSPAIKENPEHLTINGLQKEPFVLWHLNPLPSCKEKTGSTGAVMNWLGKEEARHTITNAVISEVTNLLLLAAENQACINDRKLRPGDIAILVRTNDEAKKMQHGLAKSQVPSVLHSGENLFSSKEAKEIALLLKAIAAPQNLRMVKAALLTRLIGLQPNEIRVSSPASDNIIEHWLTRFKAYHRLWNRYGFIQMFWTIMSENQIRARMLEIDNGERILTNILHLAEILHQKEYEQGWQMTPLLGYLQDKIARKQDKITEHQLRLESDADRVKIVTIHKAKGLEYPIVFCPFTWEGSRLTNSKSCIFHQLDKNNNKISLIYDGGSSELKTHIKKAMKEELAENLRLLYVAVTRAIHRCYLVWGPIRGSETSGPAYLLHQGTAEKGTPQYSADASDDNENLLWNTCSRFLELSDREFKADLDGLVKASEGTIKISSPIEKFEICSFPSEYESSKLQARNFTGAIENDWKISSFSSLATHGSSARKPNPSFENNLPGQDDWAETPEFADETMNAGHEEGEYNIFSFPHGAKAGTMLHSLLERIDLSTLEQASTNISVEDTLLSFGYSRDWKPVIIEMLSNLRKVVLHKDIPGLTLSNIPPASCLHELEFYFPLSRITPVDLKNIFNENSNISISPDNKNSLGQQLDRLTFSPVKGFMRGFIDLVFEFEGRFYLIDWKSNYLGSHPKNYHQEELTQAINDGHYFLQYHLYCFALHLYLKNRLPGYEYEKNFGGAFYIFLRGIQEDLGPDYGIFYDRPNTSMIEDLNKTFLAESSWQKSEN